MKIVETWQFGLLLNIIFNNQSFNDFNGQFIKKRSENDSNLIVKQINVRSKWINRLVLLRDARLIQKTDFECLKLVLFQEK
jgi:hypothetical protein